MAGGKRSDRELQGQEPSRKKAAVQQANDEPLPEPTAQRLASLELKLQVLGEENERLKERVETLEMRGGDQDSAPSQEEVEDAKAQPKAKTQPKRKAAKATATTRATRRARA